MQQIVAAIETGHPTVTGGLVIAAVLFAAVALLFVLFHARSLSGRTRQRRDDAHADRFDRSQVIGRFPRRTTTAHSTVRASKEGGEIDRNVSS